VLEPLTDHGTSSAAPSPTRRPTIGLVLGGGAARGFAHIGIIRALAARGIVPDVVVGTSIGAVVGGCYATGNLDSFEEWARGLQPRNIFSYLDFNLSGSGLIGGDKLATKLDATLGTARIDDMAVKYAAIATEVRTGHEIWLTHGRLTDAIRASYALPGIFAPVNIGGRWLFDGALVNPVPVSAARALGAEIVIAANVSTESFGHGGTISAFGTAPETAIAGSGAISSEPESRLGSALSGLFSVERMLKQRLFGDATRPGISTVMAEAFNIMQDRITRARLAGDPPDVLISPRVSRIGWFEFHRAEEAIALGRRAAERTIDSIEEAIALLAPTTNEPPGAGPRSPAP
jgi:NTE family protein